MISLVRDCKACWGAAHVRKDPAHRGGADAQQIVSQETKNKREGTMVAPAPFKIANILFLVPLL